MRAPYFSLLKAKFQLTPYLALSLCGWLRAAVAPAGDANPAPARPPSILSVRASALTNPQTQPEAFVSERGPHEKIWSRVQWITNQAGIATARTNSSRRELATGMHYKNQLRAWEDADSGFSILPDGSAVAQKCQHQVALSANINDTNGAVDLTTPDGSHIRSGIAGLNLFDPATGNSLQVSAVRDSSGAQTSPSEIVWFDAFEGLSADVRIRNEPGRFHQEVLLREKFSPEQLTRLGFNPDTVRLEIWTAFLGYPQVSVRSRTVSSETSRTLRASMVQPDVIDQSLDFGTMTMARGTAFGEPDLTASVTVPKQWLQIDGATWLVESVKYADLVPLLEGLPTRTASINEQKSSSRLVAGRVPPRHASPSKPGNFEVAKITRSACHPGTARRSRLCLSEHNPNQRSDPEIRYDVLHFRRGNRPQRV